MPPIRSRILLVVDQPLPRANLRRTLEYYGHEVVEASSGREGLQHFYQERTRIGLVVIDLSPADVPVARLLAGLRAIDPAAHLVLCTEQSPSELKKQEPYQALTGILRKPISTDRLLSVVRRGLPT